MTIPFCMIDHFYISNLIIEQVSIELLSSVSSQLLILKKIAKIDDVYVVCFNKKCFSNEVWTLRQCVIQCMYTCVRLTL